MGSSTFRLCVMLTCLLSVLGVIIYARFFSWNTAYSISSSDSTRGSRATSTLKFLAVVSRHGNRVPFYTFPNNPYPINDTRYWHYNSGDLTTYGRFQLYSLGAKIRSMYNGFLKPNYYSADFYATSTLLDRTMQSGLSFLAGLYPPVGFQVWDENVAWQPIPLHTDSLDKTLVCMECARFREENLISTEEFSIQYASNLTYLNNYLSQFAGVNLTVMGFQGVMSVWDSLVGERFEGFELPEWTKKVYPGVLNNLIGSLFIAFYDGTTELTRLVIGPFYDKMLGLMKDKVSGILIPDRQMFYFSGHDVSLVSLQAVLRIPKSQIIGVINPGSAMIFELHQNPNTTAHFVQVLFINGGSVNLEPIALHVPGCGEACDFDYLVNLTRRFTGVDYDQECHINTTLSLGQ